MSDSTSKPQDPEPPVIDADAQAAGDFVLRTRMLVKMGISFEDPRLQLAVQQLGIWPQLLFDLQADVAGRPAAEVRIQEADKEVEYNLTLREPLPEGDQLAKRVCAIVGWTQQLLGEEWAVVVQNRKRKASKYKTIAKGDRLKPFEAKPPTLVDAPFPEAVAEFKRYRTDEKKLERLKRDDDLDLGPILPATKR